MTDDYNAIEAAYESWVNGQRKQMVSQLLNTTFTRGEFITRLIEDYGVNKDEALKIALYLLDHG